DVGGVRGRRAAVKRRVPTVPLELVDRVADDRSVGLLGPQDVDGHRGGRGQATEEQPIGTVGRERRDLVVPGVYLLWNRPVSGRVYPLHVDLAVETDGSGRRIPGDRHGRVDGERRSRLELVLRVDKRCVRDANPRESRDRVRGGGRELKERGLLPRIA